MNEFSGEKPKTEMVTADEAIAFMEAQLRIMQQPFVFGQTEQSADFEQKYAHYATNLGHWALEAFAQQDMDGKYHLFPAASFSKGFNHEELPDDLRHIVMTESYGQVYVGNNNSLRMRSTYMPIEYDPVIPKWAEIERLRTYQQQLDAIMNDPEVLNGLVPSQFLLQPIVELEFRPDSYFKWGLQYKAHSLGVQVIPYGDYGHTEVPFQYAAERRDKPVETTRTFAELIVLAVRYGRIRNQIPSSMLLTLEQRLFGAETIPVQDVRIHPKPGNSMKNLLIEEAIKRTKR